MDQDKVALDTALTAIGALVTQLVAEIPLLIAKVQAAPTADFSTEVTALNSMASAIQTAIDQAKPVTGA